jgi:4-diphosphocytidyl-2C-methyl-D-erythritol kinase
VKTYCRKAPAKVNLALEVLGIREDGFHDLRTLFDALDFGDELRFLPKKGGSFTLSLSSGGGPEGFPLDEKNLILRAAHAYRRVFPGVLGGEFVLTKRIPMGAGLGGGSSDAAHALLLLEEAERGEGFLKRGRDPQVMESIARSLGADLPFFLKGGRAFADERGDRIFSMKDSPPLFYLLLLPGVHCDTATVFRQYHRDLTNTAHFLGSPSGRHIRQNVSNEDHPSSSQYIARIFSQESVIQTSSHPNALANPSKGPFLGTPKIARAYFDWVLHSEVPTDPLSRLFNDLRNAAIQAYPELEEIPRFLESLGLPSPHLSGSGSTFFLVFQQEDACESMAGHLASQLKKGPKNKKKPIFIVTTRSS